MAKKKSKGPLVLIVTIVILILLIVSIAIITGGKKYDVFAQCLADKGYKMAGTSWCGHCANQKEQFNGAFEDVLIPAGSYHDCDQDAEWCEENGVEGYPTWVTPEGYTMPGVQSMNTLSQVSGCPLP